MSQRIRGRQRAGIAHRGNIADAANTEHRKPFSHRDTGDGQYYKKSKSRMVLKCLEMGILILLGKVWRNLDSSTQVIKKR